MRASKRAKLAAQSLRPTLARCRGDALSALGAKGDAGGNAPLRKRDPIEFALRDHYP